ncbi:DinB family protein [Metabacillus sp. GX 13764]|uniref:DinB family protein n=1 Tax=Metabacillus kandeliae TaxID=2900151 RepID=UPI001E3A5993|nr:DinB family protein [Metabacillus kandeliae]MCD7034200.1 DinB family protein [Metabacillus kandeliae]
MNQKEYEWVRKTRQLMLNFCEDISAEDFSRELDGFGTTSIRQTLMHTADCYNAWIGSFVLLETTNPIIRNMQGLGIKEVRERFELADSYVNQLFQSLAERMDEPIVRPIPWRESSEEITDTPAKLLMHTVTHEFHHKGQVAAMLRQMGYEPPNTDILGVK